MPAPAVSTNGKTIDVSAFSDAFSKSFRIKCKVKFDAMNANYPNIFHGLSASDDVVFTSHGLGPVYGGKRGKACFYSQTKSGMGPHGRGLDAPGGWIGTSKRMDDGNWHVFELVKTGTNAQIILDGEKVEAGLPSGKTAEDFILRPIKSIQVGSAKSSGFNGDIGDVEIHAGYANKLIYSDITCKGDGLPGKATCDEQDVTACDGKYTKDLVVQAGAPDTLLDDFAVHSALAAAALLGPGLFVWLMDRLARGLSTFFYPDQKLLNDFLDLGYAYLPLTWLASLAHYLKLGLVDAGQVLPTAARTASFFVAGLAELLGTLILPLVSKEWKNGSNSSYNCNQITQIVPHSSIPY
ncbi:unnamed protein product [Symbiodinium sp. CCMP2592]|nr:unnamed protein product [Symbiodinium sp. CCMP2592]